MAEDRFSRPTTPEPRAVVRYAPPEDQLEKIRTIVEECGLSRAAVGSDRLAMTFRVADGMKALEAAITDDMMKSIMELQGTPLGFMHDRTFVKDGPKFYKVEELRPVIIEAMLRGFYPVNNEFNVIKGRFYAAKAGFHRILSEYPGLTGLHVVQGTPKPHGEGKMIVPTKAMWKLNSRAMALGMDNEVVGIVVKLNAGMGDDAALGKAMRKTLARIYERITGSAQDYGEDGSIEAEVIDVVVEPATSPAAALFGEPVPVTTSAPDPEPPAAPEPAKPHPFSWPAEADTPQKRMAALSNEFGPGASNAIKEASDKAPMPWPKQNPAERMTTLEDARKILTGETS